MKIDVWEEEQSRHELRQNSLDRAPCLSGDRAKPKISYLVVVEVAIDWEPVSFYFCPGYRGELGPLAHDRGIAAGPGQGGTVELLLPPGLQCVTFIAWITWTELNHTPCELHSTPCQHPPEEGGSRWNDLFTIYYFLGRGAWSRKGTRHRRTMKNRLIAVVAVCCFVPLAVISWIKAQLIPTGCSPSHLHSTAGHSQP